MIFSAKNVAEVMHCSPKNRSERNLWDCRIPNFEVARVSQFSVKYAYAFPYLCVQFLSSYERGQSIPFCVQVSGVGFYERTYGPGVVLFGKISTQWGSTLQLC